MPATLQQGSPFSAACASEIPISSLGAAVDHLIALNRAIHARQSQAAVKADDTYVRDFGTIIVQSGMRTGKTRLAEKYAMDSSTYLITFDNDPKALLLALDNMLGLNGVSTVVIDCWLIGLLGFQVDVRMQAAMRSETTAYQKGFTSIISYIAHRVQKALGPDALLIIMG